MPGKKGQIAFLAPNPDVLDFLVFFEDFLRFFGEYSEKFEHFVKN